MPGVPRFQRLASKKRLVIFIELLWVDLAVGSIKVCELPDFSTPSQHLPPPLDTLCPGNVPTHLLSVHLLSSFFYVAQSDVFLLFKSSDSNGETVLNTYRQQL